MSTTHSVAGSLSATLCALRSAVNRRFNALGYEITGEQWHVLKYIGAEGELTQQELQPLLHKSQSATCKLVQRLEERSLLLSRCDSKDKRCRHLALSDSGHSLLLELNRIAEEVLRDALTDISAEEQEVLQRLLLTIRENLFHFHQIPLK